MRKILFLLLTAFVYSFAQENPYIITPEEAKLKFKDYIFVFSESAEDYKKEHIPDSINIDAFYLQDIAIQNNEKQKCNYLPLCPETAKKIFSEKGISNSSKVVIYYDKTPHTATYLWFVLYSMGMPEENLKILDNGLKGWKEAGFKTTSEDCSLPKTTFNPEPRFNVIATKEEVLNYVKNKPENTVLIDVRHFLEYSGRMQIKEIKRAGHIPGARFLYWKWFLGKNHTFKPLNKIKQSLKKIKLDINKNIILYCTIGNRSSFAFLGLKAAGAKNIKIYTGGWYEWGNDPSLPIWHP
jgi:thiosulfate/3-mercaptopyruvate sulfurtransferase